MFIGIVGSRRRTSYWDFYSVARQLDILFMTRDLYWQAPKDHKKCGDENKCVHLISGGCSQGGDKFAEIIADKWKIPIEIDKYRPKYDEYGNKATFIRNELLAKDSNMLIACVAPDRTGGTEDTIKKFKKHHPQGELIIV